LKNFLSPLRASRHLSDEPLPAEQAISNEELAILWRSIVARISVFHPCSIRGLIELKY
jgi:hypothetical protein